MDYLYWIYTKDILEADKTWYARFRATYECPGCTVLYNSFRCSAIDAVVDQPPSAASLNSISPPKIGTMTVELRGALGSLAEQYLHFGSVFLSNTRQIAGIHTYIAERPLFLRGDASSFMRVCTVCSRAIYVPKGSFNVLRRELTGQPLYECEFGGLFVSQSLWHQLKDACEWRRVWVRKVPIVDEALNGVAEMPTTSSDS